MRKAISIVIGFAAAAAAVAVAPAANAAPTKSHTPPSPFRTLSPGSSQDGKGMGDVGSYPEWSTVNCNGTEENVFVAGGADPTDTSLCK